MSWDVCIIKSDGTTPFQELPNDFVPESLGDAEEVRRTLSEQFESLDWLIPIRPHSGGTTSPLSFD